MLVTARLMFAGGVLHWRGLIIRLVYTDEVLLSNLFVVQSLPFSRIPPVDSRQYIPKTSQGPEAFGQALASPMFTPLRKHKIALMHLKILLDIPLDVRCKV